LERRGRAGRGRETGEKTERENRGRKRREIVFQNLFLFCQKKKKLEVLLLPPSQSI
jgi:hypothetical protein